jgi:predicted ATPase
VGSLSVRGLLRSVDGPLVGRGEERKAVTAGVLGHRVVTIVGVGGIGKTRLGLEVASGLGDEFADGAWWCDLSVVTAPDAVAPVVLEALDTRQGSGRSPIESICDCLAGRRALLVLDNCEDVLEVVRQLVEAVRASCPTVRLLATSREALGIGSEHVVPLPSLDVDDAATLFVERALAARPAMDLGDEELASVRDICARLDGIPLAVELAAARCRSMSPGEINQHLGDRFRLLRSRRPTSGRRRTLHAAVAWSYDLLADQERDLFDSMAVFADGSLLEGVAAVAELDDYDALDLLDGLVARSMISAEATPLGTRYRQLETLRQYAQDRLVERGTLERGRDRHLRWIAELAASIRATEGTPSAGTGFRRYCAELDNIRLAVAHAATSGQRALAQQILADTWRCTVYRPTVEVQRWLDPTEDPHPWTETAAEVVGLHAYLAWADGNVNRLGELLAVVPPELRHLLPVVAARWLYELWCRGDPDTTEQAISQCRPRSAAEAQLVAAMEVGCRYARMFLPERPPDLVESTRRRAAEVVIAARRSGDDIDTICALSSEAYTHLYSDSLQIACESASEAVALAESLGTGMLTDAARLALGLALARVVTDGSADVAPVAATIRESIELAQERDDAFFAVNMLDAAAVLVEPLDPELAYLLKLVYRRAPGSIIPAVAANSIASSRRAEIERDAANIQIDTPDALPCHDVGGPQRGAQSAVGSRCRQCLGRRL